jgi:four helix bundle protein
LERTLNFAVKILEVATKLPNDPRGWEIGRQMIGSGPSVGANTREADHALTDLDFTSKCSIARKEAAETEFWLLLCARAGLLNADDVAPIITEAGELVKIFSSIVRKSQEYIARQKATAPRRKNAVS